MPKLSWIIIETIETDKHGLIILFGKDVNGKKFNIVACSGIGKYIKDAEVGDPIYFQESEIFPNFGYFVNYIKIEQS